MTWLVDLKTLQRRQTEININFVGLKKCTFTVHFFCTCYRCKGKNMIFFKISWYLACIFKNIPNISYVFGEAKQKCTYSSSYRIEMHIVGGERIASLYDISSLNYKYKDMFRICRQCQNKSDFTSYYRSLWRPKITWTKVRFCFTNI